MKKPTTIPAAYLRPLPDGYKIPVWRWMALPASAWLLKRNGGAWVGGELSLMADEIGFFKTKMMKSANPQAEWKIPLSQISDVTFKQGMASDRIEIHYSHGVVKVMGVRSADFAAALSKAASNARSQTSA